MNTVTAPSPGTTPDVEDPRWRLRAACLDMDPAVFFDGGGLARRAKKICAQCPVQQQCLVAGLSNDERFGIWGGLTHDERKKLDMADH